MVSLRPVCLARVAGVLFCSVVSVAMANAADRIAMRFDVFGPLGLRVLTMKSLVEQNPYRYVVSVDYETTGVAGLVIDQKTYAVAHGQLVAGSALPESFRNHTRRNGVERDSQLRYYPDGRVDGTTTPPLSTPVTQAAAQGTVDNLSAYLRLERQLATTGTCALTVPVFDGRHRYDLVFADAGRPTLEPQNGQNFKGPTIACRMTRRDRVIGDSEKNEGPSDGTIWYAQLIPGSGMLLPVRMKLTTQIGTVDAYLAELQSGRTSLRLIE